MDISDRVSIDNFASMSSRQSCKALNNISMVEEDPLSRPSLPWRVGSTVIMGITGSISRLFMFGANTTQVHGLDGFLEVLDKRIDVKSRQRGLITGQSC